MNLETLRNEIDAIDDQIISLLKERVEHVKQVGELKKETSASQSFIRAGREANMLRGLIKKADGVFPPAAIATIWRMVISASLSIEQQIEVCAFAGSDNSCVWLAREYFGTFVQMHSEADVENIIEKVSKNPAYVGVLPLADNSPNPWWVRPVGEVNNIYVFARIPFIEENHAFASPALAIANTCPEATGEDISLFSITTDSDRQKLSEILAMLQLDAAIVFCSGGNNYLVEISKFVPIDDAIIKAIAEALGAGSMVRLLGSYAAPVRILA